MRIFIITAYGFYPRMRNFIEFIVARLLARNGWEVYALAGSQDKTERIFKEGIHILRTSNFLIGFLNILKIIIFQRPDLIHANNLRNSHFSIAGSILAKIFRIPLVFTEYGLLHDHYLVIDRDNPFPLSQKMEKNGPILSFKKIFRDKHVLNNLKNYLFHFSLSHAETIIFVSKHNVGIAEELGFKNIKYLPHIFDDERWKLEKSTPISEDIEQTREKYKNYDLILFIGQLKLRKGWDIMLEAFPYFDKNLNIKLLFVTSSADEKTQELSEKIKKLDIKDNIIFLGKKEGEELKKIYDMSRLVVVPSRYEGFGLAVTEAWEMKKPVVATDVIAINEHVKSGYNGLLVPSENPKALAEAIEKLLRDKELCLRLVEGGVKTLNDLKSPEAKNQWLQFYKDSVKK